jgi:hypothetical protein
VVKVLQYCGGNWGYCGYGYIGCGGGTGVAMFEKVDSGDEFDFPLLGTATRSKRVECTVFRD